MAGTILTPTLIWKNFFVEQNFEERVVAESVDNGFFVRKVYFNGRDVAGEKVEIFATLVTKNQEKSTSAILYTPDFEESVDFDLIYRLADKGYAVLAVDLYGQTSEDYNYTIYPERISYANYQKVKEQLYVVTEDANQTCWYEWACVLRYSVAYLKTVLGVKRVGGFAVGETATALWQVAGMDKDLTCAVFGLNAGWAGYRGINKFGGQVEPQFSDDMYKFIAGVEPQAYAMHVTCPILVLAATNNPKYDCDRVYDTVTHVKSEVYSSVNYSVGYVNGVGSVALESAEIFFDVYLTGSKKKLPSDIAIKCEIVDGKLQFIVSGDSIKAKDTFVYVCEETYTPQIRAWRKLSGRKKNSQTGDLVFDYSPFVESEGVTAFAQSTFKDGYTIGSIIISKKFTKSEVALSYKSNVIYSSRLDNSESVFIAADSGVKNSADLKVDKRGTVEVLKGPMGIDGVYCKTGLLTFKINARTDRPQEGAILMFDVYAKQKGVAAVKLIADYFGNKVEYFSWVSVHGGEVWQNVKMEINKFKTEQGLSLKEFDKINALEFIIDGEYLINNALWV